MQAHHDEKEALIIFAPPARGQMDLLRAACGQISLNIITADRRDYGHALGTLAGVKGLPDPKLPPEIIGQIPALSAQPLYPELPGTFIVFAFLSDSRLNEALKALAGSGAGPFPYKAILTPHNMRWSVYRCFSQITQEHEAMEKAKKAAKNTRTALRRTE